MGRPVPEAPSWGLPAPRISVVVPFYNEVDNLAPLVDEMVPILEGTGRPFEIILVNDGSTDGSDRVALGIRRSDPRVRVLSFDANSGQTAAISAGIEASRGDAVLTIDADLQNDARDIPLLLERLEEWDAAVGWRARREDTWLRRISSSIANAVRNWVSKDDIIDTGCTLKAFRREALLHLKLYQGMHRFLPTLLKMQGYRVCQVPVRHRPRRAGESKYSIRNRLLPSFIDLLAVRWMKKRALSYHVSEHAEPSWPGQDRKEDRDGADVDRFAT